MMKKLQVLRIELLSYENKLKKEEKEKKDREEAKIATSRAILAKAEATANA